MPRFFFVNLNIDPNVVINDDNVPVILQVGTCHFIFSSGPTLMVKALVATSRLAGTPLLDCVGGLVG